MIYLLIDGPHYEERIVGYFTDKDEAEAYIHNINREALAKHREYTDAIYRLDNSEAEFRKKYKLENPFPTETFFYGKPQWDCYEDKESFKNDLRVYQQNRKESLRNINIRVREWENNYCCAWNQYRRENMPVRSGPYVRELYIREIEKL